MPGRIETTPPSDAPARCGVYLLTHPRSASNLFQKMMEKQPGYQNSGYKLFDAGFSSICQMSKGRLSDWPEEERKALYDGFQKAFEELQDEVADAQKNGKQAFIKEHTLFLSGPDKMFARVYKDDKVEPMIVKQRDAPDSAHTNPSSLPDRFLLSMQPIFQVRHPVLMFPSMLRAQRDSFTESLVFDNTVTPMLTLSYTRALFDWYLEHGNGPTPRLIDADDIMNDKGAVRQLCIETGLDPEAVQYEWEEQQLDPQQDPIKTRFLSTISASKGILPGLAARDLDVETEKTKWQKEFGDEYANALAKHVYDAMPDYEYLLSKRTHSK